MYVHLIARGAPISSSPKAEPVAECMGKSPINSIMTPTVQNLTAQGRRYLPDIELSRRP